jgi:hypothetical protein
MARIGTFKRPGGLLFAIGVAWWGGTGVPVSAQADKAPKAARIEVEPAEVDLGDVAPGTKIEATFRVRNTGRELLRLLSVTPG